jgi:chromosome segregation ATPase
MNIHKRCCLLALAVVTLVLPVLISCAQKAAEDHAQWKQIKNNRAEHKDVERKGNELDQERCALQEKETKTKRDIQSEQEKEKEIARRNQELKREIEHLKHQIDERNKEIAQTQKEIERLKKQGDRQEIEKLQAKLAAMEGKKAELQQRLNSLTLL